MHLQRTMDYVSDGFEGSGYNEEGSGDYETEDQRTKCYGISDDEDCYDYEGYYGSGEGSGDYTDTEEEEVEEYGEHNPTTKVTEWVAWSPPPSRPPPSPKTTTTTTVSTTSTTTTTTTQRTRHFGSGAPGMVSSNHVWLMVVSLIFLALQKRSIL